MQNILQLQNHSPYKVFYLKLTNRCNFSCQHCIEESGPNEQDEWIDIVLVEKLLKNLKDWFICVYGGEPLLNIDLCLKIRELCTKYNHYFGIATNAYWYKDDNMIDIIKNQLKPDLLSISVDKWHDKFINRKHIKQLYKKIPFVICTFEFEKQIKDIPKIDNVFASAGRAEDNNTKPCQFPNDQLIYNEVSEFDINDFLVNQTYDIKQYCKDCNRTGVTFDRDGTIYAGCSKEHRFYLGTFK